MLGIKCKKCRTVLGWPHKSLIYCECFTIGTDGGILIIDFIEFLSKPIDQICVKVDESGNELINISEKM